MTQKTRTIEETGITVRNPRSSNHRITVEGGLTNKRACLCSYWLVRYNEFARKRQRIVNSPISISRAKFIREIENFPRRTESNWIEENSRIEPEVLINGIANVLHGKQSSGIKAIYFRLWEDDNAVEITRVITHTPNILFSNVHVISL